MPHLLSLPVEIRLIILQYAATSNTIFPCEDAAIKVFVNLNILHVNASSDLSETYIVHDFHKLSNPYINLFLVNRRIYEEMSMVEVQRLSVEYLDFNESRWLRESVIFENHVQTLKFTVRVPKVIGLDYLQTGLLRGSAVEDVAKSIGSKWKCRKSFSWELIKIDDTLQMVFTLSN